MSNPRHWIILGAALAGLSVVLGAFGAHGLEAPLQKLYAGQLKNMTGLEVPASFKYAQDFVTASRYQMSHALGLILLGLVAGSHPTLCQRLAAWFFLLGIVLFSGSLYVLAVTGITRFGAVTPIGGALLIAGWVAFAIGAARSKGTVL